VSLQRILRSGGERGFLDAILKRFGAYSPAPPAGIGDDAAVLGPGASTGRLLLSTDCLLEDQHFRREEPPFLLGRKSLAVNVSDIAAMGGRPIAFLLTLAIPGDLPARFLDRFVDGLHSQARGHGIALIGGDTSRSSGPLVISITIIGRTRGREALERAGARPGDGVYVSSGLGASAAGRRLLQAGWRPVMDPSGRRLVRVVKPARRRRAPSRAAQAVLRHLDPEPRVGLGRLLLEKRIASSAIDLSDGLSLDLSRLVDASHVGARLLAPAIPIHDAARALAPLLDADPLDLALHGGEDYELLFTVPPSRESLLAELAAADPVCSALFIGRITRRPRRAPTVILADASGRGRPLPPGGYDHFLTR